MSQPRSTHAAATIAVLVALLILGFAWGVKALTAPFPAAISVSDDDTASTACPTTEVKAGKRVRPDDVVVSVLNAGTRSGLAASVLDAFSEQGFVAGAVGNAPNAGVRRVAIWSDDPSSAATRLVASAVRGADVVLKSTSQPGIVVVVGDGFTEVGTARAFVRAQSDTPVC